MIETIDWITGVLLLIPWAGAILWQAVLLVMRLCGIKVRTISMTVRHWSWHVSSLIYAYGGLATHCLVPHASWNPPNTIRYGAFWFLALCLAVDDWVFWGSDSRAWSKFVRWRRLPALVLGVGLALGWLLFPQRGEWP